MLGLTLTVTLVGESGAFPGLRDNLHDLQGFLEGDWERFAQADGGIEVIPDLVARATLPGSDRDLFLNPVELLAAAEAAADIGGLSGRTRPGKFLFRMFHE